MIFDLSRMVRGFVMVLMACGLLARAAVPAGFMPGEGPQQGRIQICTAQGLTYIPVPGETPHKGKAEICAFASVSPGLGAVQADVLFPFSLIAAEVPASLPVLAVARPIKPWFAQGPPAASHRC